MATQYDSMPVSVIGGIGGTISLQDILSAAYGDQVSTISSVRIAYRDNDYFTQMVNDKGMVVNRPTSQDFGYWDPANQHVTSVSYNGSDIGGSGANTFNLTTIDNAHFKDAMIHVGNNIMPNVYVEVTWASANGTIVAQQELNLATIPSNLDSPAIEVTRSQHAGAPTAADIVLAAEHIASVENGVANSNDCHWIAMDIAALANAPLDPVTQAAIVGKDSSGHTVVTQQPSMNEEGGFWRIAYEGSAVSHVANWETLVQAGDIVRMGWTTGGFHTTTVVAGLNADGKHPGMIRVVDNADTGGTIGEHWVDYGTITDPNQTTIYRLASDHMNLIDGTAETHHDTILGTLGNDLIKGGNGGVTLSGGLGMDHLIGGTGKDVLNGGAGVDIIEGGLGDDTLDGGAGSDIMHGGAGNDIYYVDNANDVVTEAGFNSTAFGNDTWGDMGGIDEVRTTLSRYALPDPDAISILDNRGHIENLTYVGTGNFTGVGNSLDNVIKGGAGRDTLTGGGGNDTLDGGGGIDFAVFSGNQSDYKITVNGDIATIVDLRPGSPDGTDTFTHIEFLKFADGLKEATALRPRITSSFCLPKPEALPLLLNAPSTLI